MPDDMTQATAVALLEEVRALRAEFHQHTDTLREVLARLASGDVRIQYLAAEQAEAKAERTALAKDLATLVPIAERMARVERVLMWAASLVVGSVILAVLAVVLQGVS